MKPRFDERNGRPAIGHSAGRVGKALAATQVVILSLGGSGAGGRQTRARSSTCPKRSRALPLTRHESLRRKYGPERGSIGDGRPAHGARRRTISSAVHDAGLMRNTRLMFSIDAWSQQAQVLSALDCDRTIRPPDDRVWRRARTATPTMRRSLRRRRDIRA